MKMSRPIEFSNFYENHLKVVFKALEFVKERINTHYNIIAATVDESLHEQIYEERDKTLEPITETINFFKENEKRRLMPLYEKEYIYFMNVISSSLEVYKNHVEAVQENTGVRSYNALIEQINEVSNLVGPSKGKKDLYLKFFENPQNQGQNKDLKVFISYQDRDVKIACDIKDLLIKHSVKLKDQDVFVAHRDIPLSEEWREKMIKQLDSSTHLLALCTDNYIQSPFGNQEVGYAIAKKIKIAPIFWEGTNRGRFGFLEGLQALPNYVNNQNFEDSVKEILKRLNLA